MWRLVGMLAAVLLVLLTHASAEPPHRGRDPFFEALRSVLQASPNKDILDLLRHPEVCQEIKLSGEDSKAIEKNMRAAMRQILKLRDTLRGERLNREELKTKIQATLEPFEKASMELLSSEQVDLERLIGLYVQTRNYRAAANDEVAKRIGLAGEELARFRKARSDISRRQMEETRRDIERIMRSRTGDMRKDIAKLFERAEAKVDAELAERLTDDQTAKLESLKGPAFEFPRRPFNFRGGRGREHERPKRDECCAAPQRERLGEVGDSVRHGIQHYLKFQCVFFAPHALAI